MLKLIGGAWVCYGIYKFMELRKDAGFNEALVTIAQDNNKPIWVVRLIALGYLSVAAVPLEMSKYIRRL